LAKAGVLAGLGLQDVGTLAAVSDPELLGEIFQTARGGEVNLRAAARSLCAALRVQYVRQ